MQNKTQSILIGGIVAGILSTSYLGFINMLCCAGVIIGAVVGVWHYGKTYGVAVSTKEGAIIGILVAIVAVVISAILNYVLALAGIRADQMITQIMIDSFGANMPPEQLDEMERQMNAPVTLATFFGLNFLYGLIGSSIFGAIGGLIGSAITRKNAPPSATAI